MQIKRDEAAGGVVARLDADGLAVVLIASERYGTLRWSLPKGHFKKSESTEQAALREVTEETGLTTEIVATLETIDYWFVEKHVRYHKFVHYFLMRPVGGRFEDHDDEVVDVRWYPIADALRHMAYPNERAMLEAEAARIPSLLLDDAG
jgi:8-oxo-dGTP pyrophosphatase MutT (NUDIX family)